MRRKTILFLLLGLLLSPMAVSVGAQNSQRLVGMWQKMAGPTTPSTYGKLFLPDGRLYGYCFDKNFTNMSTWMMGNYEVIDDSTYAERIRFHSEIFYQRGGPMHYDFKNDSVLVTRFTSTMANGQKQSFNEVWMKIKIPTEEAFDSICSNWETIYEQALTDFGRKPAPGQSIEQMAAKLKEDAANAIKNRKTSHGMECAMIRAELDTFNLKWQQTVVDVANITKLVPGIVDKYAQRWMRIVEEKGMKDTDSLVMEGLYSIGLLNYQRGKYAEASKLIKRVTDAQELTDALPTIETVQRWKLLGMINLSENYESSLAAIQKAMEELSQVPSDGPTGNLSEMGELVWLKGMAHLNAKNFAAATEDFEKAIDMFTSPLRNSSKINEINGFLSLTYDELIKQGDASAKKKLEAMMKDKLYKVSFSCQDGTFGKQENLYSNYYLMEIGDYTVGALVNPSRMTKDGIVIRDMRMILMKDDNYMTYDLKAGQRLDASLIIETVPVERMQQLVKAWKAERKSKTK